MMETSTNPSYRLTGIKTSVPQAGGSADGSPLGLDTWCLLLVELGLNSHSPAELLGLDGPTSLPA